MEYEGGEGKYNASNATGAAMLWDLGRWEFWGAKLAYKNLSFISYQYKWKSRSAEPLVFWLNFAFHFATN